MLATGSPDDIIRVTYDACFLRYYHLAEAKDTRIRFFGDTLEYCVGGQHDNVCNKNREKCIAWGTTWSIKRLDG